MDGLAVLGQDCRGQGREVEVVGVRLGHSHIPARLHLLYSSSSSHS